MKTRDVTTGGCSIVSGAQKTGDILTNVVGVMLLINKPIIDHVNHSQLIR